jgi:hypothetical protein
MDGSKPIQVGIRGGLSSVAGLRHTCSAGLLDMIQNHTFVGMADATLALIQHGTRLYLVDTTAITREMHYQQVSFPRAGGNWVNCMLPILCARHQVMIGVLDSLCWVQVLYRFEQVKRIKVDGGVSMKQLTLLALEMEAEGEQV